MANNTVEFKSDATSKVHIDKSSSTANDAMAQFVQEQMVEQKGRGQATAGGASTVERTQTTKDTSSLPNVEIVGTPNASGAIAGKTNEGSLGGDAGNVVRKAGSLTTQVGQTLENAWSDFKVGVSTVQKMLPQMEIGALNELENHPLTVVENVAAGAAIGAGLAFLAPEATLALGVVSAGYAGYKLAQNIPGLVHDAEVMAAPDHFSATDIAAADTSLQAVGAVALEVKAGMLGGVAGGLATGAMRAVLSDEVASVATTAMQPTLPAIDSSLPNTSYWMGDQIVSPLGVNDQSLLQISLNARGRSTLTSAISGATLLFGDSTK